MRLFKSTAPKLCGQFGALTIPNDLRCLTIKTNNRKSRIEETLWKIVTEFPLELTCNQTGGTSTLSEFVDIQPEIQRLEAIIRTKNPAALTQILRLEHLENPQFLAMLVTLNEIATGKMVQKLGKLTSLMSTDFIQSLQQFSDVIPKKIPELLSELREIDPTALFELLDELQIALNEMEYNADVRSIYKKLRIKDAPEIRGYLAYQSLRNLSFHHTIEYPIARLYQAKLICDEERNKIRLYILACLNALRTPAKNAPLIQEQVPHR